jgi:hypothetical protein
VPAGVFCCMLRSVKVPTAGPPLSDSIPRAALPGSQPGRPLCQRFSISAAVLGLPAALLDSCLVVPSLL